jgi:hypothetical protein
MDLWPEDWVHNVASDVVTGLLGVAEDASAGAAADGPAIANAAKASPHTPR